MNTFGTGQEHEVDKKSFYMKGRDFLTCYLWYHKTEIEIKNILNIEKILKIEKNRYSKKSKSDEFFDF